MKKVIDFLIRALLFTWILIAYYLISNMELKQAADLKRQEMTLKMIRFCLGWPTLLFFIMIVVALLNTCGASGKNKEAAIGAGLIIGLWVLFAYNIDLSEEWWGMNEELTPEQWDKPTESFFLLIIFWVVSFLLGLSTVFLSGYAFVFGCFICVGLITLTGNRNNRRARPPQENVAFDPDDIEQAVAEIERVHAE